MVNMFSQGLRDQVLHTPGNSWQNWAPPLLGVPSQETLAIKKYRTQNIREKSFKHYDDGHSLDVFAASGICSYSFQFYSFYLKPSSNTFECLGCTIYEGYVYSNEQRTVMNIGLASND